MPDAVIRIDRLTKTFGAFTAVDRVSFDVRRGEIFGLLGPNGAGKSTTIRMLCGIIRPTSGTALVGGVSAAREPERVRESIGYMSQKFSLYRDLSVAENIAFFAGVYGLSGERLRARAEAVLQMAGLSGLTAALAGDLSGAFQQRLALGCAILHEPPVLFLDEPTSGVDPLSRRLFWDLIQQMAAGGVTVLMTTHFMDEAEFCGRIGLISGGKLVALDTPAALRKGTLGEEVYEVATADVRRLRDGVRALADVTSVSYFGQRLHVFCREKRYTAETLAAALRARGVDPSGVARVPASLEDVFIRLVERQGEGAPS